MADRETILIADDAEINRAILRGLFEGEYNLLEAENGEQVLMLLRQYSESVAVVLLDLVMPEKDGYDVLEEMRQSKLLFHAPVVVITAEDSTDNRVRVFELGASDIIAKPFEPEVVKSRVRNLIELGRYRRRLEALVEEQSIRMNESNIAVIDMLSSVIEYRSLESGQHIRRIRLFTKILLEEVAGNYQEYHLDARKIRLITESSSMHDIGKIAIPDSILNKPGKLSPEEFEVMKTHTVKECEILAGLDRLQDPEYLKYAYDICRYHHERWDGSGYPDGLKGSSIPICAQVVAIADCYDALTSDRVYKKAISPSRAFSMILNGECGVFSPRILECFKNVREPFERLSQEYADGVLPIQAADIRPMDQAPVWETKANPSEQGQLKYFTLLRYLNCTVMEADLNTGIYHLVYLADRNLASLRSGSSFEESIHTFAGTAVHPDDRSEVLHILDDYAKELFNEGMLWRERRYRVLDGGTGSYAMYRASILRIDPDRPRLRRIMLIWHREDAPVPAGHDIDMRTNVRSIENSPFIDHLLGGIYQCVCDRYFTLIKACRKLVEISGYTEQEINEKFENRLINLIHPADRERVMDQFREQRGQGTLLEFEYRLMTKDGGVAWISSRCVVVREQGMEVSYGVLTDITKSKQAEEELRLSLERHHIIMNQTNDIIFEWNFATDELYLSSNWYKLYGYTPVTKNIRDRIPKVSHIHPGDMPAFISLMDAVFAGVPYKETDFRIANAAGIYRWCRVRATAQFDLDGRPLKAVGVIMDIDIQKRETEKMRYDHLFQSVLCGIVQYRLDGRRVVFKNANQEAIRLFGYSKEEFWAKQDWDLADLIAEEDRDYILKAASGFRQPGEKKTYEYRLLQKDKTPCWIVGTAEVILDSDGEQIIQSVYLDIDDRKKKEWNDQRLAEQMEASNEILHRALEHTTNCEFYYYPQTGTCSVPDRTCSIMHCRKYYDHMPEQFALEQVDDRYRPAFYDMYQRIHSGERTASCEFCNSKGRYWCRQTMYVIQSSEDGSPQFVIGIVEDITRQKEMEAALEAANSHDQLTGLYNKESGIHMIQDYLEHQRRADEECVLMLLDMDDFERINQTEGNVFADVILQETSDLILTETGADAVQVRIGGDEFMVFMKHCNEDRGNYVGNQISSRVGNILTGTEDNFRVSVSIGICSTAVSGEYNVLYRCAEHALKFVKEHEKGNAVCYSDIRDDQERFLTRLYLKEDISDPIDQTSLYQDQDLVSFALELLGKAKNLNDAVNLLLSRIGKQYHFDRVSILESNRSYLTYYFAYQWARNRSNLQLGQKFYVSEEDFDNCSNMYDEEGLADYNLREGISSIASCLHAGIWDYGEYVGSMSFEVDQENYRWTGEHRKLLKELVKIIPSFIMKSKADAVSRAKTDFLSRMSHEIRTPMNAINGMTTIAKGVSGNPDKTAECLEKIELANKYLLSLINDILDMDKIESGRMELSSEPVVLLQLMDSLESMFCISADEKGLKLVFINDYKKDLRICTDRLRLNQVLVNVIGNAIKFTRQGSVRVCVEEVKNGGKTALRFSVKDTGIGIEPGAQTRIFHTFEQAEAKTSSVYGGTGLGLAISHRLVQLMGGNLEVRSEAGKGSEFFFTLEFDHAQEALEDEWTEEEKPSLLDFKRFHILLVEDNEINREIAQTLLEMNGFTVSCAVNGQEALDRFCESEPGTFDAVLMDIRMPVMDGLESTRRIRTSGRTDARRIPIIALTANAFDEDTRKSMESGMNGHLSKPFQVEQMMELLNEYMS